MNHGPQYITEQALKAAAHQLRAAATFTGSHIKNPLFQKRKGNASTSVLVRYEYPGVLFVICPDTGDVLAKSLPGQPCTLDPSFSPPVPSLTSNDSHRNATGGC
jgi:hypothetical protein